MRNMSNSNSRRGRENTGVVGDCDKITEVKISAFALFFLFLIQFWGIFSGTESAGNVSAEGGYEAVTPRGFPSVGKWMLDTDLTPAHWLGEKYYGKNLREPINIIIIDGFATSPRNAVERLVADCKKAGYEKRRGHTGGYQAFLGGLRYEQLPGEKDLAFSDDPFEMNNNHGRFFGPLFWNGKYYFIGAFSREQVEPLSRIKHQYLSFNQARDNFADRMDKKTFFRISGFVDLQNTIIDNADITTGDHDGIAVVLSARK